MWNFWRRRNARFLWLVGAFLALSLTVVAPRSRIHHLAAAFKTAHTHRSVAQRTLVDQSDSRPDALIDRARREAPPDHTVEIASAPHLAALAAPIPIEPLQPRQLRRLRMAPAHTGGADFLS
jgi:hypothetical protein